MGKLRSAALESFAHPYHCRELKGEREAASNLLQRATQRRNRNGNDDQLEPSQDLVPIGGKLQFCRQGDVRQIALILARAAHRLYPLCISCPQCDLVARGKTDRQCRSPCPGT